jgi:hypothetical protein
MSTGSQIVCTIIAKNYISFARTLFDSVQSNHPGIRCCALAVDGWQGFIEPSQENFEVLSLSDIGLPDATDMSFKYDITELSTAAKPFLLRHLFSRDGVNKALYLDPDILVLQPLSVIFDKLEHADFVITPHLNDDHPDDGLMPDDSFILISGAFNLGFLGIKKSANAHAFLNWWQNKLMTKCVMEHARGYFVDQRFFDLAVSMFTGFYIERGTGFNVAYWNLHSRRLRFDGIWLCNDEPLYFFHFSAYKVENPYVISLHTNRFTFESRPDIAPLFAKYRETLIKNGYEQTHRWPYSHSCFSNGQPITYDMRKAYRAALAAGRFCADPFSVNRPEALFSSPQSAVALLKEIVRSLTPPLLWNVVRGARRRLANHRAT